MTQILFKNINMKDLHTMKVYEEQGGYRSLKKAFAQKPDEIVEKMVEGRLRKFYEEVVLLEQIYVIDGESKVRKAVEALATEIGAPVALTGFVRFALGEGVEREEGDFAAEVAAAVKG